MQYTTQKIEFSHIREEPINTLTINAEHGSITLNLTLHQTKLIKSRFERQFYIRCKEERMIYFIEEAANYRELEGLAKKYGLCDLCDFSDINLYGIKRMLRVIVTSLYRYPKLRQKFCFLGSHDGYMRAIDRLCMGDVSILHSFGLEYICSEKMAKDLGFFLSGLMKPMLLTEESYIATAVSAFGFFDAILFDKNDYEGYAYIKMISLLRENEKMGFHPKGCANAESVVFHEIGHMLDDMCGVSVSGEFKKHFSLYSKSDIERGISEYAATSEKEAVAEAFAEYMCNPYPRPMAKWIGDFINLKYK